MTAVTAVLAVGAGVIGLLTGCAIGAGARAEDAARVQRAVEALREVRRVCEEHCPEFISIKGFNRIMRVVTPALRDLGEGGEGA